MNIKITSQVLSIPPHLSITWSSIVALRSEMVNDSYTLIITLKTGDQISIQQLSDSDVHRILEAHAKYAGATLPIFPAMSFQLPMKPEMPLNPLGESMQHQPEQSNLPNIPPEILNKMITVAKTFGLDQADLEPPTPNCNCIYCQLKNALAPEEIVQDEELSFRDWEVKEVANRFYSVTSPLDKNEQYSVFLGEPIGCTCGEPNCEHIKAVLHS